VRNRDDCIAWLHSGGDQSKPQGVCPITHAHAMSDFAELRKLPFKLLHHRSADKSSRLQRASENRNQFFFQFQVRCHQVQERNCAVAVYDATLSSVAIKRRNFAGFPATMALSGTS